jgi:hypothetical protein
MPYGSEVEVNGVLYMIVQSLCDGKALAVRLPLINESPVVLIEVPA